VAKLSQLAQSFIHLIQRTEDVACAVGLSLTTLLIFIQVVNRYWLHFEIMIFGDLGLYCFIFFMFVAAPLATWSRSHVTVDIFRETVLKNRPVALAIHAVVVTVLSIVVLSLFLPQAHTFLLRAVQYPEYGTLVRWFNTSWLMIAFAACIVLVLVHLVAIGVRDIRTLSDTRSQKERE
jgi:C4-dicarboxylate transporter DctQ subunit